MSPGLSRKDREMRNHDNGEIQQASANRAVDVPFSPFPGNEQWPGLGNARMIRLAWRYESRCKIVKNVKSKNVEGRVSKGFRRKRCSAVLDECTEQVECLSDGIVVCKLETR